MSNSSPKIAWMPITSVKNAEIRTRIRVTVIMNAVGSPLSKLPVRRASHLKPHFTGKRRKRVKPIPVNST